MTAATGSAAGPARMFVLAPGPHLHAAQDTASIMWWVNGALAPVVAWGAFVFGWHALAVVAVEGLSAPTDLRALPNPYADPTAIAVPVVPELC